MSKDLLYYIEINFACIFIMLVLILSDLNAGKNDHEPRLFLSLAVSNIFFCVFDIAAIALRGTNYSFSGTALWVVNGAYLVSLSLISYFWLVYGFAVINRKFLSPKYTLPPLIPVLFIVILSLASVKTGVLFTINSQNLYERGPFIWIHWVQTWSYLLIPSVYGFYMFLKNTKRQDCLGIAFFAIAPVISGVVQMFFYGITAMQLGITISTLIVYLKIQNRQILIDNLTGLYNRGGLNKALERLMGGSKQPFYMLLIDINRFKEINDSYGHVAGDQVLVDFSNILRNVEASRPERISLYRYGGDEFVVIGRSGEANSSGDFIRLLNAEINLLNSSAKRPFDVTVSIGIEKGYTSDYTSADEILNIVDSDMYRQKNLYRKRGRSSESAGPVGYSSPANNSSAGVVRHSLDVGQRDLNNAVIKMWLIIVSVLIVTYFIEVIKGERSIPYYAVFVLITLVPWIVCFIYYKKHPESKAVGHSAQFSYLFMYSFVMLTGSTNMVFSYILVFSSLLVLYHSPKLIAFYGLTSVGLNVVSIVLKYSRGQITVANSKDFEIQIALLSLCFINMFIATKIYDRVITANRIYVDDLQRTNTEMGIMATESIITIANTIDAKDEYTKGHSQRVAEYSSMLAKKLKMTEEETKNIYSIALLHDIGKIGVPDAILKKPGKLTEEEYKIIQQHTIVGSNILKEFDTIKGVDIGTRYHHERYDGTGYPDGLAGEEIPLIARVIAVADTFDAMTTNRVYREQLDLSRVVSELYNGRGTQFDPVVADCMIQLCNEGVVPIS